jgi:hypothetical protein
MSNHFHGIVVIDNGGNNKNKIIVETPRHFVETPRRGVSTTATTKHDVDPKTGVIANRNPCHKPEWKPNSLGSTINQFKSICTKRIHKIRPDFAWQSRFYDHVIRDDSALNEIRKYIRANPIKWWQDRNNRGGLFM